MLMKDTPHALDVRCVEALMDVKLRSRSTPAESVHEETVAAL